MATAAKGSWFKAMKTGPATETLSGVTLASTNVVFVGEDTAAPEIYTVPLSGIEDEPPTFTPRTPNGTDPLNDCAYVTTGNTVAAVGDSGRVEESTDLGLTWGSQVLSGSPDLNKVVAVDGDANSRFIAVGDQAIWGQDNVGTWSSRWTGVRFWFGVAYRSGVGWVAVGQVGNSTNSPTGLNGSWVAPFQITTSGANFRDLGANDDVFLAVADQGDVWRSATGASGTWVNRPITGGPALETIVPTASTGSWVAMSLTGEAWTTTDDGDTWAQTGVAIADNVQIVRPVGTYLVATGSNGGAYLSFDFVQDDYVAPATTAQDVPPAFGANADMAGDAVRRIITQLRSGRG